MLRTLTELFSLRDLRNAGLGLIVVVGGLGLAGITLYAHQTNNVRLAAVSAGASLVFVLLILVFVIPPLARNAGREASQLNLPFEFTTGGAIMLVLILIVAFSAWNTGNNLLFIVLSFLIASMVIGFFAGSLCLKRLDIKMRFPDTIFAGEPTPILVSLTNRKRLIPAFSVVAEVRGKERERSIAANELDVMMPKWISRRLGRAPVLRRTLSHFPYLRAGSTDEHRADHVFPNRGRLSIKDFELSTKFPFGFFRHRRRLPAKTAELIVLPKLRPGDLDDHSPLGGGTLSTARRGVGLDLLALRDYQPQDDLRHVDWKATARAQQLTVREFADEDELRAVVILDTRMSNEYESGSLRARLAAEQSGFSVVASTRFEEGASIAASILSELAAKDADIQLVIGSEIDEMDHVRPHLLHSLRLLATAEPTLITEPGPDLERILDETDATHRYLVTARGVPSVSAEVLQTLKIVRF
jgi:uncharacterized protein (DUF58 family)